MALTNGMLALEARLIEAAVALFEGRIQPECYVPADTGVVDATNAIMLLSEHKTQRARTKRRAWGVALPSVESVEADIKRKLAAIRHAKATGAWHPHAISPALRVPLEGRG